MRGEERERQVKIDTKVVRKNNTDNKKETQNKIRVEDEKGKEDKRFKESQDTRSKERKEH